MTWIRVDPPRFDLWGLLVASLGATGLFALGALVLGAFFGALLIRRRRRHAAAPGSAELALHLEATTPRG